MENWRQEILYIPRLFIYETLERKMALIWKMAHALVWRDKVRQGYATVTEEEATRPQHQVHLLLGLHDSQRERRRENGIGAWERGGLGENWLTQGENCLIWCPCRPMPPSNGMMPAGRTNIFPHSGALDLFLPEQVLSWALRALSHGLEEPSCQSLVERQGWGGADAKRGQQNLAVPGRESGLYPEQWGAVRWFKPGRGRTRFDWENV